MRKKVFAALLVACMVVSMLPMAAFAAEEEAFPTVAGYGFCWERKAYGDALAGGFANTQNDWADQTMYVYFERQTTKDVWFQVKTQGPGEDDEELIWGIAADQDWTLYAFSFLNMDQWEQNPIAAADRVGWDGLTPGTTATLTVYTTTEAWSSADEFKSDQNAKAVFTHTFKLEEGEDIGGGNYAVKNIDYTFIDDYDSWEAMFDKLNNPIFGTFNDTTYKTFPRLVISYEKEHHGQPIYCYVYGGRKTVNLESGADDAKNKFFDIGLLPCPCGTEACDSDVHDDYLGLAEKNLETTELTVTLSWDEAGEQVIATKKLTYSKADPAFTFAADGEVTVGEPNSKNEIALSGAAKFVNNEEGKRYPVKLTITDTSKTAVRVVFDGEEGEESVDFENGAASVTLQLDKANAADRKYTVTVYYGEQVNEEIAGATVNLSKTYTIDGSKVTLADPTDIEVEATAAATVGKVSADGEVAAKVNGDTVTKAINQAVAQATVNAGGAAIDPEKVTVSTVTIDAKADNDTVTSSSVTLPKEVIALMTEKKVENVEIATDVATVTLPAEVLESKGADDLSLVVTKTDDAEKLPELDAGKGQDPVQPEVLYSVELQDKEGKTYDDIKDLKEPITLVFDSAEAKDVAWLEYDAKGNVVKVNKIDGATFRERKITVTVNHLTDFVLLDADSSVAKVPYDIVKYTAKPAGSATRYDVKLAGEFDGEDTEYYVTAAYVINVGGTYKTQYTIGMVDTASKTATLLLNEVDDLAEITFILTSGVYGETGFEQLASKVVK